MLMFFKSWHTAADLQRGFLSWIEAFKQFMLTDHGNAARPTMDHMQILHECKDCQVDH
ncbi:hypothetical protein L208DRAFT_1039912, partial [Tricholoma matsutake]